MNRWPDRGRSASNSRPAARNCSPCWPGCCGVHAAVAALLRRFAARRAGRRVPHAVLDLTGRPAGDDVAAVLRELHRQLSVEAFGAPRLRFRHYPLADWLMHQTLAVDLDGPASCSGSPSPAGCRWWDGSTAGSCVSSTWRPGSP
ncbi:hypothetical protein ACIODS_01340 [Micromonospora chalcea]|uniref:hypothetical protein n=1 Tax=Micromonospora chalcea TaxID=1874 RepID=UPI003830B38D